MKFINDGNFTGFVRFISFWAGVGMLIVGGFFVEKKVLSYILVNFGIVFAYLSIYSERSKIFGLKPFTNDPYGWRKAKESYKTEGDADVEKNSCK